LLFAGISFASELDQSAKLAEAGSDEVSEVGAEVSTEASPKDVHHSNPQPLKLFHTPKLVDSTIVGPASKASDSGLSSDRELESVSDTAPVEKVSATQYRYDGFIFSSNGNHYLVNGQPLQLQSSLSLISVQEEGAVIEIRSALGLLLRIPIGHTVSDISP